MEKKYFKKRKKAQLEMGETIMVLFIFFIILAIGIVFYMQMEKASLKKSRIESNLARATDVSQRINFLPEITCSFGNVVRENCFDILKLNAWTNVIENNLVEYYDEFLFSKITIKKIYPDQQSWILYDRQGDRSQKIPTLIPVLLYNATTNKSNEYSLGVLEVEVFVEEIE